MKLIDDIYQFEVNISGAPESINEATDDEREVEREKRKRQTRETDREHVVFKQQGLDRRQSFAYKRESEERTSNCSMDTDRMGRW